MSNWYLRQPMLDYLAFLLRRMGELKAEAERFAARTAAGRPPAGCACGLEELFGPDVVKKQMSAWLGLLEKNCGEKGAKCRK